MRPVISSLLEPVGSVLGYNGVIFDLTLKGLVIGRAGIPKGRIIVLKEGIVVLKGRSVVPKGRNVLEGLILAPVPTGPLLHGSGAWGLMQSR